MNPYISMRVGQVEAVAAFVARCCGTEPRFGRFNTLSFYDSRGLKVALIYNNFEWPNIGIHVASRPGSMWCHPKILYHIFAYPFIQLGCERVTAPVASWNKSSQKLVLALGFRLEGELRKALRGGDSILLYGMLREECRWLTGEYDERNVQERSSACA